MRSKLLIIAVSMLLPISVRAVASDLTAQEQEGKEALKELGFDTQKMSRRALQEASILKAYQAAWNDNDPNVTDPAKLENPQKVADHFTDGPGLLYRDICVHSGVKTKADLLRYLTVLYRKFPRQTWGEGWKSIRLFPGAQPGEWAYFYEFSMFRTLDADAKPMLTGTGMEKVKFDEEGKLISDEIHLIFDQPELVNCEF